MKIGIALLVAIMMLALIVNCGGDDSTGPSESSLTPSTLSLAYTGDSTVTCEVTASWTSCPESEFESYVLYRSESAGIASDPSSADVVTTITDVNTTEYVDAGINWNTQYYYALQTTGSGVSSVWSDEVSITTPMQEDITSYILYSIGDRWDYSFDSEITWSTKDSTCTLEGSQYTIVQDTVRHNNGQLLYYLAWDRTVYWYSGSTCIDTTYQYGEWYESITADAVYSYTAIDDMNPETKLHLPIQVGDIWNSNDGVWQNSVISLSDVVSVPSGNYAECLNIEQLASSIYEKRDVWYSKTPHNWIKITGEQELSGFSQEDWTIELTSFQAKSNTFLSPSETGCIYNLGSPEVGCSVLLR